MKPTSARKGTVLTVLNLKGGVGKTHTTWLITGVCEESGKKLLVIDTDTQGNITRSLLPEPDGRPGVEAIFDPRIDADARDLIRPSRFSSVDILPSGPILAPFDLADQAAWEEHDLQFSLVDALRDVKHEYDYIVCDCPPRLSLVSFAALCASDHVIIPLEAADWGAQGIVQVTTAVDYVREHFNENVHLLGYLVSRFKRARGYQRSYLAKLNEHFGGNAFQTLIPDLARYEKSVTVNVPISLLSPGSEEAAIARDFFDELERRIRQARRGSAQRSRRDLRQPAGTAAA